MKNLLSILLISIIVIPVIGQEALFNHYGKSEGLSSSEVFDLNQDKSGRIWVATTKGLVTLEGLSFQLHPMNDVLKQSVIVGFFKSENILGCYSTDGKLFLLDDYKLTPVALNAQLQETMLGKIVNQARPDESNNIWISNVIGGGLIEVQTDSRQIIKHNIRGDFNYFVKQLAENQFIAGSVSPVTGKSNQLRVYFSDLELEISLSGNSEFNKSKFSKLINSSYLFSAGAEVVNFDKKGIIARLFTEKKVECLFEDSEQKIWIGLNQGGVICFPTGDISSRNRIEYLSNKSVTAMFEDSDNNLWLATANSGLYQYSLNSNITYVSPVINTHTKDSNRSVQAIRIDNISPENNLNTFAQVDTIAPKIYISSIKINNRDTTLLDGYQLEAEKNFIRLSFAGSLPGNPGLFQYRYKLDGVDKEWVYTSSSFIQYTMLPPGNYLFSVEAMSKSGIWSAEPAQMQIEILPHFYQTFWFQFVVGLLIVIIGVTILWLYSRSIRSKEREKSEISKRIANLELMALRAQMNPHFIFNTLSSIQHFISGNNSEEALKYLSKFAKLMRVILDNSKKKFISISDEIKAISLYLDLEKLRFKDKFEYEIVIDPSIDPEYDEMPSMLVQPYLENAVLHGIAHKQEKGQIIINLFEENEFLVCCVEDNGVGRKKATEIRSTQTKYHKSQGMSITEDRLQIINKVNDSDLSVSIEDIYPDKEGETGTRVKIYVPLNRD